MKKIIAILACFLVLSSNSMSQTMEIIQVDVNSEYDDFASSLVRNGRFLHFTSDRDDGNQKVFVVERTSEGWAFPDEMEGDINDAFQAGSITLTPNGQYVIFAAYEHDEYSYGRTDLYSARKSFGEWTDIQNLGDNVNSEYWDSQPTMTSDGRTLYFVSDRPGGKGGLDIYVSQRNKEGSWGKAVNAGSVINTNNDEMAPVMQVDNRTMTFASNKSGGKGGYDIYNTKISGNSFSTPKNIGSPINSAYDDFFLHNVANSKKIYFSSNRSGGTGEIDLYMAIPYKASGKKKDVINLSDREFEIKSYDGNVVYDNYDYTYVEGDPVYIVDGVVYDQISNEPIGTEIIVTDLRTGQKYGDFRSDDITGEYYVVLQPGRDYSITAQKDGYLFLSEIYELSKKTKGDEVKNDMFLSPIEGGHTRLLIFFDFDKFDLKDQSIPELERVIEFLRRYPEVRIVIEGHTDDVGGADYNDKLSMDRANAVRNYLINGGIDGGRVQTEGFGKTKPLIKGTSDSARAKNRRVEMRIL